MKYTQVFLLVCFLTAQCCIRASGDETSEKDSGYDTENCIEITLPNILQLGECLGDNLHVCKGEKTLTEGVLSLANCTVSGVVKNLSPVRALLTIRDLLVALLGKLIPPLGTFLNSIEFFGLLSSNNIEDNVCHGEVKITVPNSLGKCVDDTLKLCKEGETIDISLVESLGRTVGCLVKDLLTNAPQDTVSGLLCDVARLLSSVLGQVPGGGLLSKSVENICEVVNGREDNITSRIESAYDMENCIEITLPNILQLDECLGDNLNLCQGKTTLVEGVLSLANCTVSGVVKNLSPVRVLTTIKDLLIALLGKLIPQLGTGLNALDKLVFAGDRNIEDSICHGECVDDTLKLCKDGDTIDISLVESLGKTVACIVKDLLTKTPRETVSGLLCDVARLLSTVIGQVPGGSILSKPVNEICNAATVSDTPISETSGSTPEEASNSENIGSETADNYLNQDCIEVTIPNILGIEACLKDRMNLCTGENCTVIGVFKNLTPMSALKTVQDVLVALLKKTLPPVATMMEMMPTLSTDTVIEDNTCRDPIKMGFPSSLGKCMDHTLKLCENGQAVDESIITSLLSALGCTLETILTTTPNELLSMLICDIAKAMAAILGNTFGTQQLIERLAEGTCHKSYTSK
ncbi:hypothetical protein MRX96_034856 [Rhipicephalus microplus]